VLQPSMLQATAKISTSYSVCLNWSNALRHHKRCDRITVVITWPRQRGNCDPTGTLNRSVCNYKHSSSAQTTIRCSRGTVKYLLLGYFLHLAKISIK
jgi:hypothetical protein